MARAYHNFRDLIDDLVSRYHRGDMLAFANSLGVSGSLVYHWRSGFVTRPSDQNIEMLAHIYGLDPDMLWKLFQPKKPRWARPGGAAARPLPLPAPQKPASGRRAKGDKKRYVNEQDSLQVLKNKQHYVNEVAVTGATYWSCDSSHNALSVLPKAA